MALLKWQEKYLSAISKMTNQEILDEYCYVNSADYYEGDKNDYDACRTDREEWQFEKLKKELNKRLNEVGFFKK